MTKMTWDDEKRVRSLKGLFTSDPCKIQDANLSILSTHLTVASLPFPYLLALRKPGHRTYTCLVTCRARNTHLT